MKLIKEFLLFLTLLFPQFIFSQIVINEFSASNSGSVVDPDFKGSSDWIELYNAGDSPVNLMGYFISDNAAVPAKWQLKSNFILQPDSFMLIWCDGLDTLNLHTNFKLAAEGETIVLSDNSGNLLDSITYTLQETNISFGRVCDGCTDWVYFTESSPGKTNTGKNYSGLVKTEPYFYPLGGIFKQAVTVEIKNLFSGQVRYTLDGSEPSENSTLYSSPLSIDKHTVIRARIFDGTLKPGKIITNTYFIDTDNTLGKLPVVSIASNPENFWDATKGIYVQTFKPDWEIPINIELFENDGSDRAGFNLQAGTKINGLYSWQIPQKMLGIYFRKEYGAGSLEYPLFPDMKSRKFDSFSLRASGNDWANTMFRDGMIQTSTKMNMQNETQGFRASVVFINGQYMGIHNIRSKIDADFIINESLPSGTKLDMIADEVTVEEGSITAYSAFEKFYKADLSNQVLYDSVAKMMDIQNFTDFVITEIYGINSSVGHNVMCWKPEEFGKWRWIMMDMDRCFFNPTSNNTSLFLGKTNYPFSYLMKNTGFKTMMGQRIADQIFTTFNPQRMSKLMNQFADNIRDEMPRHIERWKGTTSLNGYDAAPIESMQAWEGFISQMKTFVAQRNSLMIDDWVTNYGLKSRVNLCISTYPAGAGNITMNNLKVPLDVTTGYYPTGTTIKLSAKALPGYKFRGWQIMQDTSLVIKGDTWKYFDKGNSVGTGWQIGIFDDSAWSSGKAELGYGESDEATKISYGSNSSNKYPAYYFRKKFSLTDKDRFTSYRISLKVDDGAVIYINGKEFYRFNMRENETVNFNTYAFTDVPSEKAQIELAIDPAFLQSGENVVAVEVHQNNATSSDVSFDMQLTASILKNTYDSSADSISIPVNANLSVAGIFDNLGFCTIPAVIDQDLTLNKACSPYITNGDVIVKPGIKLTIEPGVEIRMAQDACMTINGKIEIQGTNAEPVFFHPNTQAGATQWGSLIILNATDTCHLNHLTIEDATQGKLPWAQTAAISIFKSTVRMDYITILKTKSNPIIARHSDVVMTNSNLHSAVTGDLINVKYGKARVENSDFAGNDMPDTDAIDYDGITDGIIKNCRIHDFHGSNSDAIDIGENARNINISDIVIYNITDKGVSVGQQSSMNLYNSFIMNCNLGVASKDSSEVSIKNSTFYGCNIPVTCYEKNIGSAGGNTRVQHTIISNAYQNSAFTDDKSSLKIMNSLTDNDTLSVADGNIFADPMFESASTYNFKLKAGSPALTYNNGSAIGAIRESYNDFPVMPEITALYAGNSTTDDAEFLVLENPGKKSVNLSGCIFYEGIDFTFPDSTILEPNEKFILTNNAADTFWNDKTGLKIYQWTTGRLNNDGEEIGLSTNEGIVLDHISYLPQNPWPYISNNNGVIQLKDIQSDNHFGKNWENIELNKFFSSTGLDSSVNRLHIYPNPASQYIILSINDDSKQMDILNLQSQIILSKEIVAGENRIDLNMFKPGIYIVKTAGFAEKLVIK